MSRFDYLLKKIEGADFSFEPFRHIYISDFFDEMDFAEITGAPEIDIPAALSDEDLFEKLRDAGYKVVNFPGCITNKKVYMKWHANKGAHREIHSACEGFGITLRLFDARTSAIAELNSFLSSEAFNRVLARKLQVPFEACHSDTGIQKYLDGYEISPHPDVRRKAATFMVNINPHADSEECVHHTHYLRFRDERRHVGEYWAENPDTERCWVPWDWCETVKLQPENNSIVIFSPGNDTVHGVKAHYDHLPAQRTQLYGNLWYSQSPELKQREWEDFDGQGRTRRRSARQIVAQALPSNVRRMVQKVRTQLQSSDTGVREY